MATKPLQSDKVNSLVNQIRNTKSRTIILRKPVITPVEGRVTVLTLSSGKTPLGTITTRTRQEAARLAKSQEVSLRIGWDANRNEKILADFTY